METLYIYFLIYSPLCPKQHAKHLATEGTL